MTVSFVFSSPNLILFALSRLVILPDGYTSVPPSSECRIFHTALSQDGCGACAAFAISAFVSMHACLSDKEDTIPSPHRLFDCANGTCEGGVTYEHALSVLRFGVEDVRDALPQFGMPCHIEYGARPNRHMPTITHILEDPLQIKMALMLFGPLLGSMNHHINRDPLSRAYTLLNETFPPPTKLHAIVVLGWDAAGNWIVQNSWGDQWGDEFGRGRIAQGALVYAFDPTVITAIRICYLCVVVCMACSLLGAGKRERRFYLATYIVLLLFGLFPAMLLSWRKGIL